MKSVRYKTLAGMARGLANDGVSWAVLEEDHQRLPSSDMPTIPGTCRPQDHLHFSHSYFKYLFSHPHEPSFCTGDGAHVNLW